MSSGCHRPLLAAVVNCVVLWAEHHVWSAKIICLFHQKLTLCTTLKDTTD